MGKELVESITALPKAKKKKLLQKIGQALRALEKPSPQSLPRVDAIHQNEEHCTTEGEDGFIHPAPPVTTTNDPADPQVLRKTPRTHLKQTRANNPGHLAPINTIHPPQRRSIRHNLEVVEAIPIAATTPNSNRIPMARASIISQEAVNMVTGRVYGDVTATWLP